MNWVLETIVFSVVFAQGVAWCRPLAQESGRLSRLGLSAVLVARIVAASVLSASLISFFLAMIGQWSLTSFLAGCLVVAVAGTVTGSRRDRASLVRCWRCAFVGFAAAVTATVVGLHLYETSEWVAGGWDPGVYVNQAASIAATGSARPPPSPVYRDLAAQDGIDIFSRQVSGRFEAFPGIPVDPQRGAFDFYFYPVTPSLAAILYRLGGALLVVRLPFVVAVWAGLVLVGALCSSGLAPREAVTGLILLALQPIFLYHAVTPCSEMTELFCMLVVLLGLSDRGSRRGAGLLFLACLVGILNRPGFVLTTGVIALASVIRPPGAQRSVFSWDWLAPVPALALGMLYYHTLGRGSLVKIGRVYGWLEMVAVGAVASAFVVSCVLPARVRSRGVGRRILRGALWGLPFALGAGAVFLNPRGFGEAYSYLKHLLPYVGWPWVAAGAVGFGIWSWRFLLRPMPGALDLWSLICLTAVLPPLMYKVAADLYPWATKRVLSAGVPLLVVFALMPLLNVEWLRGRARSWWRGAWWLTLLALTACRLSQVSAVHRCREYRGTISLLSQVARELSADDVVVADHFKWGAPLGFLFQKQVLNGERLWADPGAARSHAALSFLRGQVEQGRRVLLVTSSRDGVGIFPAAVARRAVEVREFAPRTVQEVVHHRNADSFQTRPRMVCFTLYRWYPSVEEAGGHAE